MTRAGALLLLCAALLFIAGGSEWLGPGLPKDSDTFPGQHWACQKGRGCLTYFWWVPYRECPHIFLFQSVMTSAQPWGTLLTCSYREAMMSILNKLKSITKILMYWRLPIPWRAVLMRNWQQRISKMLWALWWVRLCVNVPMWGGGVRGLLRPLGSGGHHFLYTLALPPRTWEQKEPREWADREEVANTQCGKGSCRKTQFSLGALELVLTGLCLVTGLGPSRSSWPCDVTCLWS